MGADQDAVTVGLQFDGIAKESTKTYPKRLTSGLECYFTYF